MKRKALKAAFPQTIPIMTGFLFLGFAYGIYANTSGFSFVYPLFMSMLIYGGSLLTFDTDGLSFVMTAMFVVIFLEQWLKEKNHTSSLIGLGVALICLLIFGSDSFMVPTMICIILLLTLLRTKLEKTED